MRSTAFSRLLAFTAALLLAAGCAGAPLAAGSPPRPSATADHAYPASGEADPSHAYPAAGEAAPAAEGVYPQPAAATAVIPGQQGATPVLRYRVVNSYPHDAEAYTQGLVYVGDDTFYEGTGLEGYSSLREVELATGNVRTIFPLDKTFFGEGVAVVGERIFQLTWRNGRGFIYDYQGGRFVRSGEFTYPPAGSEFPREGWGLATDGQQLIMSDGTATLYFVDPEATASTGVLAITRQVEVRDQGSPVANLNELEYIGGEVYANIWQQDVIARIDPASGRVTAYIDLSGLRAQLPTPGEVLNGIAYDAAGDRLFVTGKLWPRLFEIEIVSGVSWIVYLPVAEAA